MSTINNQLIDRIAQKFKDKFDHWPQAVARAPGRVNLLGEHVDYNAGFVMPAAIDRATYVAFSRSPDDISSLVAIDFNDQVSFTGESIQAKERADGTALPDWALYPAGVAHELQQAGYPLAALQAVIASDVPRGAGLSSSASVEVAFISAWQHLGRMSLPVMKKALLCQQAENRYVGVNCGIMDQFASVCGKENRLLQLDCRSLDWSTIALPVNISIVIADTGIRRKLTSGEYNQRRQDCEQAVQLLQADLPNIRTLRDVSLLDFEKYGKKLPPVVEMRARHVVTEIKRTVEAKSLLAVGDIHNFGRLMNECHLSLRDLYQVSCPELDVMVTIAQSQPGCFGARLTGAGFGGCTVNLVDTAHVEGFVTALKQDYQAKTSQTAEVYITRAASGAGIFSRGERES